MSRIEMLKNLVPGRGHRSIRWVLLAPLALFAAIAVLLGFGYLGPVAPELLEQKLRQFIAGLRAEGADRVSVPDITAGDVALRAGRTATPRSLPDIRFVDGAGAPRSLADFRGRVILLNVWATWCAPCREEMPALDRLQGSLGGPGFEVVALSIDRGGVHLIKRFYEELGLRALGIYVDENGEALSKLGAVGIPLTLLVDRDGRELWRVVGPREWDKPAEVSRIRSHLAQAPAR